MARKRRRNRSGSVSTSPRADTSVGDPPGTLTPPVDAEASVIDVIGYGPLEITDRAGVSMDELRRLKTEANVTWVNVTGVGSAETLKKLGDLFELHALALEDVVNVHQRPKVEGYGGTAFVVLNVPKLDTDSGRLELEQLSIFIGPRFVITVQERRGDYLEPIRSRLRSDRGRIRNAGADYLAYAVIDTVVDSFFPIAERLADRLDELEDNVIAGIDVAAHLHTIRHDFHALRRILWPTREAINVLLRGETGPIEPGTLIYLRDCADHTAQLADLVDASREAGASLMDLQIAQAGSRMNEIMKMLTLIATIFIPLGFIAGLYGMNFDPQKSPFNMPELGWYWGYPFALSLMAATATSLLVFFRRKGWLGGKNRAAASTLGLSHSGASLAEPKTTHDVRA